MWHVLATLLYISCIVLIVFYKHTKRILIYTILNNITNMPKEDFNVDETSVVDISGSIFVRIPARMAKHLGLKGNTPRKGKIEYLNQKSAKLTFE